MLILPYYQYGIYFSIFHIEIYNFYLFSVRKPTQMLILLYTNHCHYHSVITQVPGAVCRDNMKFLRFNVLGPSTKPSSLVSRDLLVSNEHGTTYVPYMLERITTSGWMGILYTGETYDWNFDNSAQVCGWSC